MIPGAGPADRRRRADGRKEIPVGSLEPVRDFTDVDDVVVAYRLLVERGEPGEVYNVCSGVGRSVAEVAEHLLGLARHAIELVPDPRWCGPSRSPASWATTRRLRAGDRLGAGHPLRGHPGRHPRPLADRGGGP